MSGAAQPGRTCPACGAPLPAGREVCPSCGHISRWFKVRLWGGCIFALLAFAGVIGMLIMALYAPR